MTTVNFMSGEFSSAEAKELLLKLVDSKINFYKIRNLKSQVSSNKPDNEAQLKIKELKEVREQIISLVQKAKDDNSSIEIESTINMTLDAGVQQREHVRRQEVAYCN